MREEKLTDDFLKKVAWARDFLAAYKPDKLSGGGSSIDNSPGTDHRKASDILGDLYQIVIPPPEPDNICSTCRSSKAMSEIHPQGVLPDCSNLASIAKMIVEHYLNNEELLLERFDHPDDDIIFIASHCMEMYDVFRCHGANHYQAMTGVFLEFMFAVCEGWL